MARYGNGGGHGRRVTDFEDEPVDKALIPIPGANLNRIKSAATMMPKTKLPLPPASSAKPMRSIGALPVSKSHWSRVKTVFGKPTRREKATANVNAFKARVKHAAEAKAPKMSNQKAAGYAAGVGAFGASTGYGMGQVKAHREFEDRFAPKVRRGRMIVTADEVDKAARNYNAEHRRQRRLGMTEAGLAGLGAAGMFVGGRGLRKTTKTMRTLAPKIAAQPDEVKHLQGAYAGSKRDLAMLGGGAAAVTGAGVTRQKAEGRRMGIWR